MLPPWEQPDVPATPGEAAAERPSVQYVLYFDFTHLKHESYRLAFDAAERWVDEHLHTAGWKHRKRQRPANGGLRLCGWMAI